LNIKIDKHLETPAITAALFDLDGTLLDRDEQIPAEIIEKIKYISKYIPTTIASGRIFSSVKYYSTILDLSSPQISDNGAIIFDPKKDDKIIFSRSINREICEIIFNLLDSNNFEYFASAKSVEMTHGSKLKTIDNVNIITCFYDDVIKYISKDKFNFINKISLVPSTGSSDEKYLSFMPKNVNKGLAIDYYCSYLNLDKTKLFAIGDGLNDLEMLKNVGISVAMGNSNPTLFKVSKFKTNNFSNNGTIEALDWIIRGLK
tara:strand:+ start:885 stop:1664 length:780 start_codon:yes stop_codon:yes gene_type:complete